MDGKVDIRSYQIRTEDGRVFRANRKQLWAVRPVHDTIDTQYDVDISVPVREPEHCPPLGPASGLDKGMGNLGLVPSTEAENALVPQASSSPAPRLGSSRVGQRPAYLKDYVGSRISCASLCCFQSWCTLYSSLFCSFLKLEG